MKSSNQKPLPIQDCGLDFSHVSFGSLDEIGRHSFSGISGKLFLKEALALTGMEVSINRMEPGQGMPFMHSHRVNEELYVILSGSGQFMIGDRVIEIGPGSCIRVAPSGSRCWRNTGDSPLQFLCIQAPAGGMSGQCNEDGVGAGRPHWNRHCKEDRP